MALYIITTNETIAASIQAFSRYFSIPIAALFAARIADIFQFDKMKKAGILRPRPRTLILNQQNLL